MKITDVSPMGAVRMTRRGKFLSIKAQRYMHYKQLIGYQLRSQCKKPYEGAIRLSVTFCMPVPASWSKKKQREHIGVPVVVKPDVDNLVKGLMDAANGILWKDDNQVSDITVKKRYAYEGAIELEVEQIA